ncbi:MAG TPA: LLM class flavin-dependent oxidoreductase [Ilumatobacteraceae bacterium]|nr:LLM class flavin-dependent oxidoreductase [Ilumatobacteraceae bacterium]HRB04404.1 LLM class flavin-dependent oxidoreductase [Ilumatobacteraceae bacterium]
MGRLRAGVHIVPMMGAGDVIEIAIHAERLGYDYCFIADEGFLPDVYVSLGAIARETQHITLGVMTNGYTRHPAVTAAALATVNGLAPGRVVGTMLAGGSMVLGPMGIQRDRPYQVMAETIEAMRQLWSGEPVTWTGDTTALVGAELSLGRQEIPIWIAGRGPLVLGLAGRHADGVILTVKPDLGGALEIVASATGADTPGPKRVYLGRICYTPEMLEAQRPILSYVLMDSPPRALESLGMDADAIALVQAAAQCHDASMVAPLVTDELLRHYQVAGTPAECAAEIAEMADVHGLHAVFVDALSSDLDENISIIENSLPIITGSST